MKYWLVRDYDPDPKKCTPWDDIVQIQAGDEHEAAEQHARRECASDAECYVGYESGRFLEVKEASRTPYGTRLDVREETSTLVSVTVSLEPHFSSRIERRLSKETAA